MTDTKKVAAEKVVKEAPVAKPVAEKVVKEAPVAKPVAKKETPVAKPVAEKVVKEAVVAKPVAKKEPAVAKPVVKKAAPKKATIAGKADLSKATYATGKRKDSVARVYLLPGKGNVYVNGIPMGEYFKRAVLRMILEQPFGITNREAAYDIYAFVHGGGLSGQAGAVRHGVSKALNIIEPELRAPLKSAGMLTRDSRIVERKHYGKRKARRSKQFSKR